MREKHGNSEIEILYETSPTRAREVLSVVHDNLHCINHIAFTPEKSVFYIEINTASLIRSDLEDLLSKIISPLGAENF